MELVKKVEVITNSLELRQVLKILEKIAVSGYTIIKNVTGTGDKGRILND